MEQIDDCCHRFERYRQQQNHRHHHHHHTYSNNNPQHMCTIQNNRNIPTVAFQSLDTVRALHQTVVHLRNALEEANREIETLKKQIIVKDDIEEGRKYREQQQQHQNAELNEIYGKQMLTIDLSNMDIEHNKQIEVQTHRTDSQVQNINSKDIPIDVEHKSTQSLNDDDQTFNCKLKTNNKRSHTTETSYKNYSVVNEHQENKTILRPIKTDIKFNKISDIETSEAPTSSARRTKQMASKIDVKIKLTSNFKIDGSESSSDVTGDNNSGKIF